MFIVCSAMFALLLIRGANVMGVIEQMLKLKLRARKWQGLRHDLLVPFAIA